MDVKVMDYFALAEKHDGFLFVKRNCCLLFFGPGEPIQFEDIERCIHKCRLLNITILDSRSASRDNSFSPSWEDRDFDFCFFREKNVYVSKPATRRYLTLAK